MKPIRLVLFLLSLVVLAAPGFSQTYSPFYTSALSGVAPWYWNSVGAWIPTAYGATSSTPTGGSLIYGSSFTGEYEIRTTYGLSQTGGTFITYLEASSNAQVGVSGNYYAVELANVTFAGGGVLLTSILSRV